MAKEQPRIALAGNPNSGKTTLFNNITGARQHVGNYPGVTVERIEGTRTVKGRQMLFIDLPGTYSLTARSLDELVARNVIIQDSPEAIIDVVDASNLERNLYLTAQLVELEKPLIVALNMVDVAEGMGYRINAQKLAENLGAEVVETIGRVNKGTDELLDTVADVVERKTHKKVFVDYGTELESAILNVEDRVKSFDKIEAPSRWVAIKLLEDDADVVRQIGKMHGGAPVVALARAHRETLATKVDLDTIFQEKRHEFAVNVFRNSVESFDQMKETKSDKIDKILTNRWLGLPLFALIMFVMFNMVITLGAYPQDWLDAGFTALSDFTDASMVDGPLKSLMIDGIIAGVGAVLSFLPLVLLLFFGISLLEDSGYMARAAFVIDRAMRGVGLHGKSFIPLLIGFGCSVPAVMGARILDNPRDRLITIFATPFMSCGAKLPVYVLLIGAFFPTAWGGTMLFLVYFIGVILALITTKILRLTILKGEPEPFVMELPPYHLPTARSVLLHMWDRAWLYIKKAGTFIMAASILVWFLVSYPENVEYSQDFDAAKAQVEQSYELKADELLAANQLTDQKDEVQALVDSLQEKYEAAKAAEEEEEEAEGDDPMEEISVHDQILAAKEKGENVLALEAEEKAEKEAAELKELEEKAGFAEIKAENEKLYPTALTIFQYNLDKDGELEEIDTKMASEKQEQSYAAVFGKAIEPIIAPLGFDWKIGVGVVASMIAKEVLISTLGIIYATQADDEDNASLQYILAADPHFTPAVALALMAFVLVFPPCIAALSVIKKETSFKWMIIMFGYGCAFSWIVSFVVYHLALYFGFGI